MQLPQSRCYLAAAERGRFDPSTWEVYEPFTEDEYQLVSARHQRRTIELPFSLTERDITLLRTREHEWTHFRQHVSTGHGIFVHRLCGLQESLAISYFRETQERGIRYQDVPFDVLFHEADDPNIRSLLAIWHYAEALRGLLWGKTATMGEVIKAWDAVVQTLSTAATDRLFMGDMSGARLTTIRSLDAPSCPHGHLTIRDVAEGFAKFRELWHVALNLGPEVAYYFVRPTLTDTYGAAARFIQSRLGLGTLADPFIGALLETAMLTFDDPLTVDRTSLVWEDIHPGLRLERAVMRHVNGSRAFPEKAEDCYFEARRWFGLDEGLSALARWHLGSAGTERSVQDELSGIHALLAESRVFQHDLILGAVDLRQRYPCIYYSPESVEVEAQIEFRNLLRPPLIATPSGLFAPWGWGRDGTTIIPNLVQTFCARALEEVAHDGTLTSTIAYAKTASAYLKRHMGEGDPSIADRIFGEDSVQGVLRLVFGDAACRVLLEGYN